MTRRHRELGERWGWIALAILLALVVLGFVVVFASAPTSA